jgi:hypothetical protein
MTHPDPAAVCPGRAPRNWQSTVAGPHGGNTREEVFHTDD